MTIAGLIVILALSSAAVPASPAADSTEFSSYKEMRARVGELFTQQRLEEAAEILEGHLGKFPDHLEANAFNLAFMCVRLGRHEKCLEVLGYALDREVWFSTFALEGEMWAPLRDLDGFDEILARNESFRLAAQAIAKPDLVVVTPEEYTTQKEYPLFIALHGGDGNMNDFKNVWKSDLLREQFIVAYVQSSQVVSMSGFSWEDHEMARRDIADAYRKIKDEYSVDTSEVLIGGFSSGGFASLDIVLSNTLPVAGFVALCPAKPDTLLTAENLRGVRDRGVRGTILTTEMDGRLLDQKEMVEMFKAAGLQYQFVVTPDVGHWIPDDIGIRIDQGVAHIRSR